VNRYYDLLGIAPGATLADLKSAYHLLAKRNHPDLFPDERRQHQQLQMMRINEAYMAVMAALVEPGKSRRAPAAPGTPGASPGQDPESEFLRRWDLRSRPGPASESRALGTPRDPAYSYYKAGFRYYGLGATELSRKEAPKIRRYLATTGTADGYILRLALRALHYFERAYSYFLVVVEQYGESPWSHDARYKLRRLEKFSAIYQRICENLSRRSSTSRSSFSMVSGADPS
jgi:hypothetical protein